MSYQHRGLLDWLREPDETRGGRFTNDGDEWHEVSYADLAATTRQFATLLRTRGVRIGDTVPILLPGGSDFVSAFFGALLIGATPAPIAPPMAFQKRGAYERHLATLLRLCNASVIVTDNETLAQIPSDSSQSDLLVANECRTTTELSDLPSTLPGSIGLLQFTSGSGGVIRGVRVPLTSLEANINAICQWTRAMPDDLGCVWLPVHHDMGLIGNLLMAIVTGMTFATLRPEHFIADPLRWLAFYGEQGACLGSSPSFGLAYITRRVAPSDLAGMDFSNWRALVCGSERIDKSTLDEFSALLAPAGFDRRAILPAYGLAEATLAVTGKLLTDEVHSLRVDSSALSMGAPAKLLKAGGSHQQWLVSCGRPIDHQTTLAILDGDGRALPPGTLGEIAIEGPTVAAGYARGSSGPTATRFEAGRLLTGDAGFVLDGELYVIGRLGDSLKLRGKAIFAEDVDALVHQAAGLGSHNAVALLGVREGHETVVVVVEEDEGPWVAELARVLVAVDPDLRVRVISAPRGTIKRTTSGKPRRRTMWTALDANERARVIYQSAAPEAPVLPRTGAHTGAQARIAE